MHRRGYNNGPWNLIDCKGKHRYEVRDGEWVCALEIQKNGRIFRVPAV